MRISIHSAILLAAALLFATALTLPLLAQQGPPLSNAVGGLTPAQRQAFAEGARVFAKNYVVAEGLGPVFNDESCDDCHRGGGGTNRTVTRFGRLDARGDFDALAILGGSLRQSRGIGAITTADGTHEFGGERTPNQATITTPRRSASLRGLGFVDAVPDETWEAIAEEERAADEATAGRVHMVENLSTRRRAAGKFGWKAQVPSLLQFSADALLNEMGITNPLFRDEPCPQGDCDALAFNPTPALNDDGHDTEAIADFMTMLAAPTRGPVTDDVVAGELIFQEIGCANCHRPTIRTGRSDIAALNRTDFRPYSDFLLHDMGSLGDGIVQEQASGREFRTAPLWGLRNNNRLLHDGRSRSLEDAIRRHDGQGAAARDRFNALDADRVARLLAFLRSL
jgi:CxxC motif-containing protein (DUF1111 family)